jgi:hypothetical protein
MIRRIEGVDDGLKQEYYIERTQILATSFNFHCPESHSLKARQGRFQRISRTLPGGVKHHDFRTGW